MRTYELKISSDVGTRYLTTNSVEELGAVLQRQTTPPIFYEVSEAGDLVFSLMIDGGGCTTVVVERRRPSLLHAV